MPDLMIAPRYAGHLDRVVAALRLVHESDCYPMAWPDDPTAWLTPAGSLDAWVALSDGEVVGHVMLMDGGKVEYAAELAEAAGVPVTGLAGVSRLFVTPAARRTGVAAALLERVEDTPARRGRRLVLDVVDDGGPAVRLYERLGWVRVAAGEATWTAPTGIRPRTAAYLSPRGPSGECWLFALSKRSDGANSQHSTKLRGPRGPLLGGGGTPSWPGRGQPGRRS